MTSIQQKTFSLICISKEGSVICTNNSQSWKAFSSISVIEGGITICVSDEHLPKGLELIFC